MADLDSIQVRDTLAKDGGLSRGTRDRERIARVYDHPPPSASATSLQRRSEFPDSTVAWAICHLLPDETSRDRHAGGLRAAEGRGSGTDGDLLPGVHSPAAAYSLGTTATALRFRAQSRDTELALPINTGLRMRRRPICLQRIRGRFSGSNRGSAVQPLTRHEISISAPCGHQSLQPQHHFTWPAPDRTRAAGFPQWGNAHTTAFTRHRLATR